MPSRIADLRPHYPLLLSIGAALLTGLIALQQLSRAASLADTLSSKHAQYSAEQVDARRILALREAPQRATDRRTPHDQLVARIDQALRQAGIGGDRLRSVWPEPARRMAGSDYKELVTRLAIEDITCQQAIAFCHHLMRADPSLRVTGLRLLNRKASGPNWDVEIDVSYLLFAPGKAMSAIPAQASVVGNPDSVSGISLY